MKQKRKLVGRKRRDVKNKIKFVEEQIDWANKGLMAAIGRGAKVAGAGEE